MTSPRTSASFPSGASVAAAGIRGIVFGDMRDHRLVALDRTSRELSEGRSDVSYRFRHYVKHENCNPWSEAYENTLSCYVAKMMEAAADTQGDEAFWKFYDWVLANQSTLDSGRAVNIAAHQLGFVPVDLLERAGSAEVRDRISAEGFVLESMGKRGGPWVFINERAVTGRFEVASPSLLAKIFAAAAAGK